jgi:hypothetical protein
VPDEAELPIFLLDGGDVAVYADLRAFCADVEPWMADQPVDFYDARARPLRLLIEGRKTVGVEVAETAARPDALRDKLRRYLDAVGEPVPVDPDITGFARAAAGLIERR